MYICCMFRNKYKHYYYYYFLFYFILLLCKFIYMKNNYPTYSTNIKLTVTYTLYMFLTLLILTYTIYACTSYNTNITIRKR